MNNEYDIGYETGYEDGYDKGRADSGEFQYDEEDLEYRYDCGREDAILDFFKNFCSSLQVEFSDDDSIDCRITGDETIEIKINGKKFNINEFGDKVR